MSSKGTYVFAIGLGIFEKVRTFLTPLSLIAAAF